MSAVSSEEVGGTPRAGAFYAALISEQLVNERTRKTALEQRGVTVITTAGGLVTILFALGALVTGTEDYSPPGAATALLLTSLIFFLVSAVAALATNAVRSYDVAKVSSLESLLDEKYWQGREEIGQRRTSELRLKVLATARKQNEEKAKYLKIALTAETIAVVAVAAAVAVVLVVG